VPGAGAEDLPAANRFYVTLRWIRQAAADRPLLLALDDLHWADPDSLTFLQLLCRRASLGPLTFCAKCRCRWPGAGR
jgi:predicted ATPase